MVATQTKFCYLGYLCYLHSCECTNNCRMHFQFQVHFQNQILCLDSMQFDSRGKPVAAIHCHGQKGNQVRLVSRENSCLQNLQQDKAQKQPAQPQNLASITKTRPCNIQRFFLGCKNDNFHLNFFTIFFNFLLKI